MNEDIFTTDESTPPRSRQSSFELTRQQINLQRIIESNEEIIYQQSKIITNLTIELNQLTKSNSDLQRRYQILSELALEDTDEKTIKERNARLIAKIEELEQTLVKAKIQSATKQSEILNAKYQLKKLRTQNRRQSLKLDSVDFDNLSKSKIVDLIENQSPTKLNIKDVEIKNETHSEKEIKQWQKILQIEQPFKNLRNKKIREKCKPYIKKFIPSQLRQKAWPIFIQNKLALSKQFYTELLQNASPPEKIIVQIQKDIQRSFPQSRQFNENKVLIKDLQQMLQLFHCYRPDVSYVQGMTYPATILLLVLQKKKAFKYFCNIVISNEFVRNLYSFNIKKITLYCRTFDYILQEHIPWLSEKLYELNLNSEIYLIQWFYTFFSRAFTLPTIFKVWDLFVYYGEVAFFRIALGILQLVKNELDGKSYELCINIIKQFDKYVDQKKLIQVVLANKLNEEKLHNIMNKVKELKRNSAQIS